MFPRCMNFVMNYVKFVSTKFTKTYDDVHEVYLWSQNTNTEPMEQTQGYEMRKGVPNYVNFVNTMITKYTKLSRVWFTGSEH